jgi:hypothetical protein
MADAAVAAITEGPCGQRIQRFTVPQAVDEARGSGELQRWYDGKRVTKCALTPWFLLSSSGRSQKSRGEFPGKPFRKEGLNTVRTLSASDA